MGIVDSDSGPSNPTKMIICTHNNVVGAYVLVDFAGL